MVRSRKRVEGAEGERRRACEERAKREFVENHRMSREGSKRG